MLSPSRPPHRPELPAFLLGPQPSGQEACAETGTVRGWPASFLAPVREEDGSGVGPVGFLTLGRLLGVTGPGCVLDHHPEGEGWLRLHHLL